MDENSKSEAIPAKSHAAVERRSGRELVVTRAINGPARLVFEAWTKGRTIQEVVGTQNRLG